MMQFEYFYGKEADTFSFYRVPKILFSESYFMGLSIEAKVLYGLMLDRMSLSLKNQWVDDEGKIYINFSVENIQEYLNCSKNKAVSILKELDSEGGIGLIEKKRPGQGKPTIIYVKNFASKEFLQNRKNWDSDQNDTVSESQKINFLNPINCDSRSLKNGILESQNLGSNNININNTDLNNNSNLIISSSSELHSEFDADENRSEEKECIQLMEKNIEWDILRERYPMDYEIIEGIHDLLTETILTRSKTIVIARNEYDIELVRRKLLRLDTGHIEYVIRGLKNNTTRVVNIKKYLLAALFNAPSTIGGYYQAAVNCV